MHFKRAKTDSQRKPLNNMECGRYRCLYNLKYPPIFFIGKLQIQLENMDISLILDETKSLKGTVVNQNTLETTFCQAID